MTWTAHIVYDADGTKHATITGERLSTQILPNGDGTCRSLVIAYDDQWVTLETFQAARTHSIHRVRQDGDGRDG